MKSSMGKEEFKKGDTLEHRMPGRFNTTYIVCEIIGDLFFLEEADCASPSIGYTKDALHRLFRVIQPSE